VTPPDPRLGEIEAIPAEAVEAAARSFPGYTPEDEADDLEREINAACRSTARRILEAAAPLMTAKALEDAAADIDKGKWQHPAWRNPAQWLRDRATYEGLGGK